MAARKKPMADLAAAAAGAEEDMPDMDAGMPGLDAAMPLGGEPEPEGEYDLDQDVFASEMAVAFPELAEDPARLDAFKEAIKACVKATREE